MVFSISHMRGRLGHLRVLKAGSRSFSCILDLSLYEGEPEAEFYHTFSYTLSCPVSENQKLASRGIERIHFDKGFRSDDGKTKTRLSLRPKVSPKTHFFAPT
jgi:hypothetical protein